MKWIYVKNFLQCLNNPGGEIHHLSGVWKSLIRFCGNRNFGKKEIVFSITPYNESIPFIV